MEALKAMVEKSSRRYFTQAWGGRGIVSEGSRRRELVTLIPGLEGVHVPQLAVLVLRAADQQQQLPHLPEDKRVSG